jgi:HAD superfamily phosphoserine phosphatase-like hydrolase
MNKKLVVLDIDNTLITGNTWADFNRAMSVTDADDLRLYTAFANGDITYQEWLHELMSLYKLDTQKHSKEQVLDYLTQYKLKEDAVQAVADITKAGHDTLLLTGSFQITADAVAFELGITNAIATTRCVFDENGYLSDLVSQGDEQHAKLRLLQVYCGERNIQLQDCIVVGDGANDKILFQAFPNSVTFTNSDPDSKSIATHKIQSLRELPTLVEQL